MLSRRLILGSPALINIPKNFKSSKLNKQLVKDVNEIGYHIVDFRHMIKHIKPYEVYKNIKESKVNRDSISYGIDYQKATTNMRIDKLDDKYLQNLQDMQHIQDYMNLHFNEIAKLELENVNIKETHNDFQLRALTGKHRNLIKEYWHIDGGYLTSVINFFGEGTFIMPYIHSVSLDIQYPKSDIYNIAPNGIPNKLLPSNKVIEVPEGHIIFFSGQQRCDKSKHTVHCAPHNINPRLLAISFYYKN